MSQSVPHVQTFGAMIAWPFAAGTNHSGRLVSRANSQRVTKLYWNFEIRGYDYIVALESTIQRGSHTV